VRLGEHTEASLDTTAGRLRSVLAALTTERRTVYVVQPLHRQGAPKIRVFIDYLAEALQGRSPIKSAQAQRGEVCGKNHALIVP
jgi:hypothetical protein